ncbi:hypothetical protein EJ05DRAFT_540317 [Pseudovirgaria hyperparasitica]|uniref:Uncharacterized protein n=1 Tax=Pseudovirgaria hyperparasitica TaxID=470096 RepID=A0A6A6VYC6_9PEZI|nr:uncharacterized protein EJ05DRAFT_540317 [Pseudovirgaria hyperparasitica]KAF2755632.1 hypothetical protein EJ05DRAFT_540317 [Pseudovirgaria hyperparasitica]
MTMNTVEINEVLKKALSIIHGGLQLQFGRTLAMVKVIPPGIFREGEDIPRTIEAVERQAALFFVKLLKKLLDLVKETRRVLEDLNCDLIYKELSRIRVANDRANSVPADRDRYNSEISDRNTVIHAVAKMLRDKYIGLLKDWTTLDKYITTIKEETSEHTATA